MRYYPIFLDLSGKDVLVAGAGQVGRRKLSSVLAARPGRVTLVDPGLDRELLERLFPHPALTCHARAFDPADLEGRSLVFAATGNPEVNALIASLCADKGILCNVADAPEKGGFIVPAHFSQGELTIALSTHGQSPALARVLRRELEAWAGKRYTPLLTVLGRLRPLVLELNLPTEENSALFRSLIQSPLTDFLENRNIAAASDLLAALLPVPLHARMGEVLHGI